VQWIVGHAVERMPSRAVGAAAQGGLHVSDLAGPGLAAPLSFAAARGEIVAFTGLIGCGAREAVRLLAGAARPHAGTALLDGTPLPLGDAAALGRASCAYVPGDRHAEGTAQDLSIRENLFLARLGGADRDAVMRRPWRERASALALMQQLDVRPADDPERPVATLSGGNQQKVVVGRALHRRPRLLLLDDPTIGVDVGARAALHRLLRGAADRGATIVFSSSDFDEVAAEASRALIFRQGRLACTLTGGDLTRDRLVTESY
jgi:ribose transport system ATP-binding protein